MANHRVKSHSFYCSDCIFGHFFCNYFDNNKNTVYVLGHKYTQTQFNPHLAARAKMTLSQAQNIFMPVNINCICFITRLHRTRTVSVWPLSSFSTMVLKWYHYFNWKNYPRWHALKCRMSKKKTTKKNIYISMSQKLTSTFTNHFKMIIRLYKRRISCEGIFSQNNMRMRAWNSASRKKNKSNRLCPAAVYWYLNSHVTTEEFWESCFSSCHERGTNKKFWVPMRNRKYQNKSFKHCHSFLKRNAMDFHKQLKSWKRLKNRGICLQEKFLLLVQVIKNYN